MNAIPIELRIRHPKGNSTLTTLYENSSIYDLKKEIGKLMNIPASQVALKIGYPPQKVDLPENTTLENLGLYSGESVIAEETQAGAFANPIQTKADQKPVTQSFVPLSTGPKTSNQQTSHKVTQIPNPDGLIMIRRIIPADNSCLFNSIAYALENKAKNKANDLRKIVAKYIASDPETYNEAVLERSNARYCEWIQKSESWGGAIELEILSKFYKVEIGAVDIENLLVNVFGSGMNYKDRIYVLYDGIHYDIFARNISEEMDEAMDITVFSPNDKYAYEGVLAVAKELKEKKQFTNVNNFTIQCGICYQKFKGENEAVNHNKQTGHLNFQEVASK